MIAGGDGNANAWQKRKKAEADIVRGTGSSGISKEAFLSTANNVTAADSYCLITEVVSLHPSGLFLFPGGVVQFGFGETSLRIAYNTRQVFPGIRNEFE